MTVEQCPADVVSIKVVDPKDVPMLLKLANSSEATYWEFLNPTWVNAFFIKEDTEFRAEKYVDRIKEAQRQGEVRSDFAPGRAHGLLIVKWESNGSVMHRPIGSAIGKAMDAVVTSAAMG